MDADRAERPLLLVHRTGRREFREYLLRSLSRRYRIHMLMTVPPTWEPRYVTSWTVLEDRPVDPELVVAAALEVAGRERVDGVLCWDEARVLQAAHAAAALGLPGGDPAMIGRCRDKHLTRQALAAAGVPQPRSVQAGTLDEAFAAARRFGWPLVVKPRDLALSMGVTKVDTPEELAAAFAVTSGIRLPNLPRWRAQVLVEEFADGPEISVDSAVHRGRVFPLCLARKELGYPPHCIEVGHTVHADDPLLADPELLAVLQDAHTALGFTDGVTHTEVKLTSTGPEIIEVNGRLGGDLIPYLGLRATGVDVALAAAAVACGRRPEVVPDRRLVAGVRFFYVQKDDTLITSVRFDEAGLPPAVDQLVVLAKAGTTTSPPPAGTVLGRIAFATAVAATAEECRHALDAAEAALHVND